MTSRFVGTSSAANTRAVVDAAIRDRAPVRLHLIDTLNPGAAPRSVEGTPKEVLLGRDGRERVIVEVGSATEPVEVRLLLDRIARAERTAASEEQSRQATRPSPAVGANGGTDELEIDLRDHTRRVPVVPPRNRG